MTYFGTKGLYRNGNIVQGDAPGTYTTPPAGVSTVTRVEYPNLKPAFVTNSDASRAEAIPCSGSMTLEDTSIMDSGGLEVFAVPAMQNVTIPDIPYVDSDLVVRSVRYGDPIVCTPGAVPVTTTYNGVDSLVPDITVLQAGSPVGTFDPVTGIATIAPCVPGEAYPVDTDGDPVGPAVPVASGASVPVTAPDGSVRTSDGSTEVMPIKSGEIKPLPKSKILYIDATGAYVFTATSHNKFDGNLFPATPIPCRELQASDGSPVSTPATYVALDHLIDDTLPKAPDSSITVNSAAFANALSGGALNVPVKDTDGVLRGSKVGGEWIVPAPGVGPVLEFAFADRDQYTMVWTIKSFTAGTYTSFTPTGTYGTITYSKNGGAFSAVTGSIVLAIGDTIQLKRTNTTGVAGTTWVP